MVINWSDLALKRLKEIFDYYAKEANRKMANTIVTDISLATDKLKFFPTMAIREPLLSEYPIIYRSLIARKNYKIVYYIQDNVIRIVTVWDCRQNPDKLKTEIENETVGDNERYAIR